jgi:hypothetical protein
MTTATGEYAFNFAAQANQSPFTNANFTDLLAGHAQISSGLLRQLSFADYLVGYTGGTYDGGPITVSAEIDATGDGDEVLLGALDQSGDGLLLRVGPSSVAVLVYTGFAVVDSAGTGSATLSASDLYAFTVTKGSPNTYSATRNGAPITLSQSSEAKSLGTLRAVWGHIAGNVGASAIKSIAVVDGLSAGIATVSPSNAALSVGGRLPLVNAFSSVLIREVLINEAGSPVANQAAMHLVVWYGGSPFGAADLSYSNMTTDPAGTASWSIAKGTLVFGQRIFYFAHDGHTSMSVYTCAQITPTYLP